jgi:S-adenosylmethionine:tRNA ribosyltransferase-isomerase
MKLIEFDYHLPQSHIAQIPATPRDSARLLVMGKDNGHLEDKVFSDIADML